VEAVGLIVLLRAAFFLVGVILTGTRSSVALGLAGIVAAVLVAAILIRDALRVRVKLNDLDAAQFPSEPEVQEFAAVAEDAEGSRRMTGLI
jgi:hypothetical protein